MMITKPAIIMEALNLGLVVRRTIRTEEHLIISKTFYCLDENNNLSNRLSNPGIQCATVRDFIEWANSFNQDDINDILICIAQEEIQRRLDERDTTGKS